MVLQPASGSFCQLAASRCSSALCTGSGSIKEPFEMLVQLLEQMWVQIIGYIQILELWMPMKCSLKMLICYLNVLLGSGGQTHHGMVQVLTSVTSWFTRSEAGAEEIKICPVSFLHHLQETPLYVYINIYVYSLMKLSLSIKSLFITIPLLPGLDDSLPAFFLFA